MRINAYVLMADPAFLQASLLSYYNHVDRIVLSFDENATSWTGTPLPVEQCLDLAAAIDRDRKCVPTPGTFSRLDHDPLANDTFQRQHALDAASVDADWVVQLDSDEVMFDPGRFFRALQRAEDTGTRGLDYPSRWLYARVGRDRYLEATTRFWRTSASYPGPLAVRSGVRLSLARQAEVPLYRVDLRRTNTDPRHNRSAVVHEAIPASSAVVHYSWVRSHDHMRRKFAWSGHAATYTDPVVYRRWASRQRHPVWTTATTLLRRRDWYRISTIRDQPPSRRP